MLKFDIYDVLGLKNPYLNNSDENSPTITEAISRISPNDDSTPAVNYPPNIPGTIDNLPNTIVKAPGNDTIAPTLGKGGRIIAHQPLHPDDEEPLPLTLEQRIDRDEELINNPALKNVREKTQVNYYDNTQNLKSKNPVFEPSNYLADIKKSVFADLPGKTSDADKEAPLNNSKVSDGVAPPSASKKTPLVIGDPQNDASVYIESPNQDNLQPGEIRVRSTANDKGGFYIARSSANGNYELAPETKANKIITYSPEEIESEYKKFLAFQRIPDTKENKQAFLNAIKPTDGTSGYQSNTLAPPTARQIKQGETFKLPELKNFVNKAPALLNNSPAVTKQVAQPIQKTAAIDGDIVPVNYSELPENGNARDFGAQKVAEYLGKKYDIPIGYVYGNLAKLGGGMTSSAIREGMAREKTNIYNFTVNREIIDQIRAGDQALKSAILSRFADTGEISSEDRKQLYNLGVTDNEIDRITNADTEEAKTARALAERSAARNKLFEQEAIAKELAEEKRRLYDPTIGERAQNLASNINPLNPVIEGARKIYDFTHGTYNSDITDAEIQNRLDAFAPGKLSREQIDEAHQAGQNLNFLERGYDDSLGKLDRSGAGFLRPFASLGLGEDLYKSTLQRANQQQLAASVNRDNSLLGEVGEFFGGLPIDLLRRAALLRLPGGAIVGLAADEALQASGAGKPAWQIAQAAEKGAAQGLTFGAGKVAGNIASKFSPLVEPVARLGTVALGSTAVELAYGTPLPQAVKTGILNAVSEGVGAYGKQVLGKVGRVWSKGKSYDIEVNPKGNVSLVKFKSNANPNRVDFEMVLDPESEAYQRADYAKNVTPQNSARPVKGLPGEEPPSSEPKSNDNIFKGQDESTPPPRELAEKNPLRINTPNDEAVQRVGDSIRAQKISGLLSDGKNQSITSLVKATGRSLEEIIATLEDLYGARMIEILPDNTVRLIQSEGAQNVGLYDRLKNKNGASQSLSPINQKVSLPPAENQAPTGQEMAFPTETEPTAFTPKNGVAFAQAPQFNDTPALQFENNDTNSSKSITKPFAEPENTAQNLNEFAANQPTGGALVKVDPNRKIDLTSIKSPLPVDVDSTDETGKQYENKLAAISKENENFNNYINLGLIDEDGFFTHKGYEINRQLNDPHHNVVDLKVPYSELAVPSPVSGAPSKVKISANSLELEQNNPSTDEYKVAKEDMDRKADNQLSTDFTGDYKENTSSGTLQNSPDISKRLAEIITHRMRVRNRPEQILEIINDPRNGLDPKAINRLGINQWLDSRKGDSISQKEILKFINARSHQVKDASKSEPVEADRIKDIYGAQTAERIQTLKNSTVQELARAAEDLIHSQNLILQKGAAAQHLVNAASNAFDVLLSTRNSAAPLTVADFLKRERRTGREFSPAARAFAFRMEDGTFGDFFAEKLGKLKSLVPEPLDGANDVLFSAKKNKEEDPSLVISSEVRGDELIVSPVAAAILMRALQKISAGFFEFSEVPEIAGMYLPDFSVTAYSKALKQFADSAENSGLDPEPYDKLRKNLLEAAKENGTVIVHDGDENTLSHERIHQASDLGSRGIEGVWKPHRKRYANREEIINDPDFKTFHPHINELEGLDLPPGKAIEEAMAYLAMGDEKDFELDKEQAIELLTKIIEGYADANGVESFKHFKKVKSRRLHRIIKEVVKKVNERKRK